MANLTISIDDEILKQARIWAIENNTSVNSLLRDYLKVFVGQHLCKKPLQEFLSLTTDVASGSGSYGRTWKREDLYDR
ncbi:MAG: hypothetical protein JW841_18710 [Deltaproteobacteria bacterium]|nr:hypothetical protein [Deltaproteobacteria bacterium]